MARAGVLKEERNGRTDAARKQECALKKGEEVVAQELRTTPSSIASEATQLCARGRWK